MRPIRYYWVPITAHHSTHQSKERERAQVWSQHPSIKLDRENMRDTSKGEQSRARNLLDQGEFCLESSSGRDSTHTEGGGQRGRYVQKYLRRMKDRR